MKNKILSKMLAISLATVITLPYVSFNTDLVFANQITEKSEQTNSNQTSDLEESLKTIELSKTNQQNDKTETSHVSEATEATSESIEADPNQTENTNSQSKSSESATATATDETETSTEENSPTATSQATSIPTEKVETRLITPYATFTSANWIKESPMDPEIPADREEADFEMIYTLSYDVSLSGTNKNLVVKIPKQLKIENYNTSANHTKIKSTSISTNATTGEQTLTIVFLEGESGGTAVDVGISVIPNLVYSLQLFTLNAVFTVDSVIHTNYANSLKMYDIRQGSSIAHVSARHRIENPTLVYENSKTTMSVFLNMGTYQTSSNDFRVWTSTFNLDLKKIKVNGSTITNDQLNKITVYANDTVYVYDTINKMIKFKPKYLSFFGDTLYNIKFDFPANTVITMPQVQDYVAYENNLITEPKARTEALELSTTTPTFTIAKLQVSADSGITPMVDGYDINYNRDRLTYLIKDDTNTRMLSRVVFKNGVIPLSNLNFDVIVPSGIEVTKIFVGSSVPSAFLNFTISDENGNSLTNVTSSGLKTLNSSFQGGTMRITFKNIIPASSIMPDMMWFRNSFELMGLVHGNSGTTQKFELKNVKADFTVGEESFENTSIEEIDATNNELPLVISEKAIKEFQFMAPSFFDEYLSPKNVFKTGEEMFLGTSIGQYRYYYYATNNHEVKDLIFYFSVPQGFISRRDNFEFTNEDIAIEGNNTIDTSKAEVSVLKGNDGLPYEGYNAGGFIVKVKLNESSLRLMDYETGKTLYENMQLFLKLKVSEDEKVTREVPYKPQTVTFGTFDPQAKYIRIQWQPALIGPTDPDVIKDREAIAGGILTYWDTRAADAKVTIQVVPIAEMNVYINTNIAQAGGGFFTSFDPSKPDIIPETKLGLTGSYKVRILNNSASNKSNVKGYFIIPRQQGQWAPEAIGQLNPLAGSKSNAKVYYTIASVTQQDADSWSTGDDSSATWQLVTAATDLKTVTALKFEFPTGLNISEFYETTFNFKVKPLIDVDELEYNQASHGITSYKMDAVEIAGGKTAALKLIKSIPPKLKFATELEDINHIEYWTGYDEVAALKANWKRYTLKDDVNILGNEEVTLDEKASMVKFIPAGMTRNFSMFSNDGIAFEDFNPNTFTARRIGNYQISYVSTKDFDNQTSAINTDLDARFIKTIAVSIKNPLPVVNPDVTNIKLIPDKKQIQNEQGQTINWDAVVKIPEATELKNYYKYQVDFKMPADSLIEFTDAKLFSGLTEITNFGSASKKDSVISFNFTDMENMLTYAEQNLTIRYKTKYNGTGKPVQSELLGYASAYANNNQNVGFNPSEATVKVDKGWTNEDNYAPVITVKNQIIEWEVNKKITEQNILDAAGISGSDNKDSKVEIFMTGLETINYKVLGDYTVYLNAKDSSNNVATQKTVIIRVLDKKPPNISSLSPRYYDVEDYIALAKFIKDASAIATDNYDKNVAININDYKNVNFGKIGTYTVNLSAIDSSGNKAQNKTVVVEIMKKGSTDGDGNLLPKKEETPKPVATPVATQAVVATSTAKPIITENSTINQKETNKPNATQSTKPDSTGDIGSSKETSSQNPDETSKPSSSYKPIVPDKELEDNGDGKIKDKITEELKNKDGKYDDVNYGKEKDSFGYGEEDLWGVGIIVAPTFKYFKIGEKDLPYNIKISKDGMYFVMIDKNGNELGYSILKKGGNPRNANDWLLYVDQNGFPVGIHFKKQNPSTKDTTSPEVLIAFGATTFSLLGISIVLNRKKEENEK